MTQINDQLIREMVEKVLAHVQSGWGGRVAPAVGKGAAEPVGTGTFVPAGPLSSGHSARAGRLAKRVRAVRGCE